MVGNMTDMKETAPLNPVDADWAARVRRLAGQRGDQLDGVVKLVATNYGLFEPTGDGFRIREIAPGITLDEVHATVGCRLTVPENLPLVRMVG